MPNLAEIYLQDNRICEIRSMARCLFPKLYFIGLGHYLLYSGTNNLIHDFSALACMPADELQWIGG